MKRRNYVMLGIGVAGAMGIKTLLADEDKKDRILGRFEGVKEKAVSWWNRNKLEDCADTLEKAGHPDPHDIPDNKMVDEGAQYSVQYYSQKKIDEKDL